MKCRKIQRTVRVGWLDYSKVLGTIDRAVELLSQSKDEQERLRLGAEIMAAINDFTAELSARFLEIRGLLKLDTRPE